MSKLQAAWVGFRQPDKDPWEMYESYAKIGYHAMDGDLDALGGDRKENIRRFNDLGLVNISTWGARLTPLDLAKNDEECAKIVERAHAYGVDHFCLGPTSVIASFNSFYGNNGTYEELMQDIEGMNLLCDRMEKEGLKVLYHNHYQEFTVSYNGASVMDHYMTLVPKLKLKLDVGWVWVGGEDPVAFMEKAKDRIHLLHVKDFYDMMIPRHLINQRPETRIGFTTLGSGKVDIQGVLKKATEIGQKYAIVEQDTMRNLSMEESLTASYLHMKESGYCE